MTDRPPSAHARGHDDGELLAAYLAGELDDVTAARLERRLRTDPQLGARLDAITETRARLQRLDTVEPPAGFRQRLDSRLAAERSSPGSGARRHAVHRRRWQPFAAAAALVLLAVTGAGILLAPRGDDMATSAAEDAAEPDRPPAEAPARVEEEAEEDDNVEAEEQAADDGAGGDEAADQELLEEPNAAEVPAVDSDADLAALFRDSLAQASDATRNMAAIKAEERRARERAGLDPATSCLTAPELPGTPVSALVVDVSGERVVAIAVAGDEGADAGSIVLVDPATCDERRVVPLDR